MRRASPGSLGRWLSRRLAFQTFAGLGVVCLGVYLVTLLSLTARQRDELRNQEEVARHLLGEVSRGGNLAEMKHKLDDFFGAHPGLKLTLRTSDGEAFYSNASATREAAATVLESHFSLPSSAAPGGVFEGDLAMDTSADSQVLFRLAWTLFAFAFIGSLTISAAGFRLVEQAMAPVRELADQTRRLGASRLDGRLDGSAQSEELQPLVDQFNALLSRLEQAYAQMEGFNEDVAHELRTPLATMRGECELALRADAGVDELRDVLGSNLEELQRLSIVVNAMLFLSKAARGAEARRVAVPSLAVIAAEVIEFHDAPLQEAGVQVLVTGDSEGHYDVPLVRQAISNLLANATRFAAPASTIEIHLEASAGDRVRVTVSNVGPMIEPEHVPRLFDRFYRVDKARERGDAHHGLGLSIVAAVARMHGGQTHARSAAGRTTIGFDMTQA